MSIIYRKVARDLLHNKTRTLLVVLSTAVGILALGMVLSLSDMMVSRMSAEWESARAAHVTLYLNGAVDEETTQILARTPGVVEIEPVTYATIRWKHPGETEWRNGSLLARQDYERQRLDLVFRWSGLWPRGKSVCVERQAGNYFGVRPGGYVVFEIDQVEYLLPVECVMRDLSTFPPQFGSDATFFVTLPTLQNMSRMDGYNRLLIRQPEFNRTEANKLVEQLKERLKKIGLTAGYDIQDPKRHFIMEELEPVMLIMGVLGALSLALSAFLVVNTVNAVLAQQVSQIGMMKAIGATVGRVMRVYLVMVLIYGVMAVVIAVPLAALAAHALAGALLPLLSIDVGAMRIVPRAVVVQLAVGLSAPVLAALWPVLVGVRVTVREAIASYGLGADFGSGPIDKLIARVRRLPRPLALSLRNTFRRKGRMVLTQITLVIAGVMFMTVMSASTTLTYTTDQLFEAYGFDVRIFFDQPQRFERAEAVARTVPGVVGGEVWSGYSGTFEMGGNRKRQVFFRALPPNSAVFRPTVTVGRWLSPDDGNVMVVNQKIADEEGLKVGDQINVDLGDAGHSTWKIVGLIVDIYNRDSVFAPRDSFSRVAHQPDQGGQFWIKTDRHDPAYQATMEKRLRTAFETNSMKVSYSYTAYTNKQQSLSQFNILIYLLLAMSVLAGLVGSLGLMGTMSINVLERSKEVGVMRAIGASSPAIVGIFVIEGVILGLLSATMAIPLSYPASRLFSDALVNLVFKFPLNFRYSWGGLAMWLGIIVALSALASLWPAMRAARVSVRETLAYE